MNCWATTLESTQGIPNYNIKMLPRKRHSSSASRHKVKCQECHREFDSDYASKHFQTMHKEMLKDGRTPAVLRVVPESQAKISRFFNTGERLHANVSTSTAHEDVVADSPESVELQLLTDEETEDAAAIEVEREREECTNANELEGEHGESNGEEGGEEEEEEECDDEEYDDEEEGEESVGEENEEGVINEYGSNEDDVGHSPTLQINNAPRQPVLRKFPVTKISGRNRSFSPKWYSMYPWISYSIATDEATCFACSKFGYRNRKQFVF